MKAKKNSKANLERFTKLFLLIGLVVSLLITDIALEMKTYDDVSSKNIEYKIFDSSNDFEIPETKIEIEISKPKSHATPEPILEKIEIIADDKDIEETVIESTEVELGEAIVLKKIIYTEIEEEEIIEEVVEDVPFFVIEKVPTFPGCTGTKEQLRNCLQKAINNHVSSNFNVDLAQDLGLTPGKKRIFVMFTIDKNGAITDVRSRAPHKRLQKEAERVIKSLPKMKPGEQRGKPVGVKYSLPIIFQVK
ncbi:MAG TPA: energy transducer TonB [Lutibacter sp.]|nr:energy transducer TonB [Lutibacter sp.]